jgi:hypothetical protein
VESCFRLRGIDNDQQKFDHLLSALPAEMVSQVINLMENLSELNQYEYFKTQLLDIHQLSDYEKFDVLAKMEPIGGRTPSQLLHAMLEFCPVGMRKHLSFHYFFMQRLPQALSTQLGEVQPGDPCPLATRANKLWSVHLATKKRHSLCRRSRGACASQGSRSQRWKQGPGRKEPWTRGYQGQLQA